MVRKTARSCSEFNKCLDGNHGVPYVRFAILKAIFFFVYFTLNYYTALKLEAVGRYQAKKLM